MIETLRKIVGETSEPTEKIVRLFIRSKLIVLNGDWSWEMQTNAVYCSDVMSFPDDFYGTKGIIHPDDISNIKGALELMSETEIAALNFRLITTYGEVKHISGKRVSIEDHGKQGRQAETETEPWQRIIKDLIAGKQLDFLHFRKELIEVTEKLHSIGSWFINKDTTEVWYSDNVYRLYGLPPQSLNAHANTFIHFIHPDDRIAVRDAFETSYAMEVPLHLEYSITRADGETRRVRQVTQWTFNGKGELIFSGIFSDITDDHVLSREKEQVEAGLKLHQQILRFSEQYTNCGYWLINMVTRKATYSDNYYRIFGLKKTKLPDYNSFLNLVHPEDYAIIKEQQEKMYRDHVLTETEFRIIRPDGKMRHLQQTGKIFLHGAELFMVAVVQDITVIKGLEKKIHELNETIELKTIVNEMTEGMTDASSIIWYNDGMMQWSDGFYKLLGYKVGAVEPMQKLLHKSIHPDDLRAFKDAELLVMNRQVHDDLYFRIVTRSGIRQLKISFRQVSYGSKQAAVAVVQDITKQTTIEQLLTDNKNLVSLLENSINDAIILTDSEHTIIGWNASAEQQTGIRRDDAMNYNLFDVFPQLNEDGYLGQLSAALMGREKTEGKIRNGYFKKPHQYRLTPIRNEREEITGVLHVVEDVSRELELQQRLSERLNFIQGLVEASVDRIVVLDRHMNYLYWNKKAEEYYAIPKERVIGKNILEVFPGFRNDPSYSEFRKVLRGETIHIPATSSEEHNEYFETYLVPIKDEKNDVTDVLWLVHDLRKEFELQQEKKKADIKIQEQAHYLQRITETVPVMLSITELKTRTFTYLNPQVFAFHGFEPETMLKKTRDELAARIHPESRKILNNYFEGFTNASDDTIILAEYQAKDENGDWKWFLTRGRVFQRDENNHPTHILNVIENISYRKDTEEHSKHAEAIINTVNEACYELDKEGRVVFVNRQALEWWSKTKEAILGKNIWDIFPESVDTHCYDAIQLSALNNNKFAQYEYMSAVLTKWISLSATPTETGCIVLFRQIEDAKKMD